MYDSVETVMTVRINSRSATVAETAAVLGVSAKRVRELRTIIDHAKASRRAMGISWTPPAATSKSLGAVIAHTVKKRRKNSGVKPFSESSKIKHLKRSKGPLRTKRRGKKSKSTRRSVSKHPV